MIDKVIVNGVDVFEELEKHKKLLELYKKLNIIYEKLYGMELSLLIFNSNYYEIEIIKLKHQIRELETDLIIQTIKELENNEK